MGRTKPTTTTPRWPKYDMLKPAEKTNLRHRIHPKIETRRELMKKRDICVDRGICFDGFPEDSTIPSTIYNFGWEHFCATRGNYDPDIVREFYAALNAGIFNEFGEVYMGDTTVVITHEAIRSFYQLPRFEESDIRKMLGGVPRIDGVGDREEKSELIAGALRRNGYSRWAKDTKLKKSELHVDTAFWMVFLKASVIPSKHTNVVDSAVARVLFCIQNGMALDIPQIIRLEILDAARSKDIGVLPFPCLVTHFCKSAGIPSRAPCAPSTDFTRRTYNLQVTYCGKLEAQQMYEDEDLPKAVKRADKQTAASDDDDSDYDPEEIRTLPSTPLLTAPSHDMSILTRLESKVDFAIKEIQALRTSVERMEAQRENRGSGEGDHTSESRQPRKRRQAPALSSKKPQ